MDENKIQVLIRGGMGNQMFQVAFAKALAIRFQAELELVDMSSNARVERNWSLSCFGLEPKLISKKLKFFILLRILVQRIFLRFSPEVSLGVLIEQEEFSPPRECKYPPNLVSGYWQCRKCFEKYSDDIKKFFTFPELPANFDITLQIRNQSPSVAIHIRRGDYSDDSIARSIHLVCTPEWYSDAWNSLRKQLGECHAIVYSDDVDWVKSNVLLEGNVFYSDNEDSAEWFDMASMSKCDHFIISNSTYSWWAAFLGATSESIVIAPKQWLVGKKTVDIGMCPESWTLI
jgi:hypothetical protein